MNKWFQLMLAIGIGMWFATLLWFLTQLFIAWIYGLLNPMPLKFY